MTEPSPSADERSPEELYDFICGTIGFEDDTKELREAIKLFGQAVARESKRELLGKYYNSIDQSNNAHMWGDYSFSGREAWNGVNNRLKEMKQELDDLDQRVSEELNNDK